MIAKTYLADAGQYIWAISKDFELKRVENCNGRYVLSDAPRGLLHGPNLQRRILGFHKGA